MSVPPPSLNAELAPVPQLLMQIPRDMFPGVTRTPPRHVCGDGQVFFLGRSNHSPVDSRKAGFDAIDVVAAFYRPPGQIDEAIIHGTARERSCKNRACRL